MQTTKVTKGDKIRVTSLSYPLSFYCTDKNNDMRNMVGKVFTVKYVGESDVNISATYTPSKKLWVDGGPQGWYIKHTDYVAIKTTVIDLKEIYANY